MAHGAIHDSGFWRRRPLTIPPNSRRAWIQLAVWEIWMGMLFGVALALGLSLIVTAPDKFVTISDFTLCYGLPPIPSPCERVVYRGGLLNVAFTALCGVMLVGLAVWLAWELWSAVEPKPVTDDFLKLLNDSFGRDWRNPFTWPWARVVWAYGFTAVGATLIAGIGFTIWMFVARSEAARAPAVRVETSQTFRLGQ